MSDAMAKMARWRLRLAKADFEVVHRAGIKHKYVDALSRLERTREDERPLDDDLSVLILHASSDCVSEDEELL